MGESVSSGKLIAVEGADGAGTTTVSQLIRERMARAIGDDNVRWTAQPSTGPIGNYIRRFLDGTLRGVPNRAMELLFRADRIDHDRHFVRMLLDKGKWVVTDRHYPSTLVYQSVPIFESKPNTDGDAFANFAIDHMSKMFAECHGDDAVRIPDLTIYLKAAPLVLRSRRDKRGSNKEIFEDESFQEKAVRLYDIWSSARVFEGEEGRQWRIVTVDANRPIEHVMKDCMRETELILECRACHTVNK